MFAHLSIKVNVLKMMKTLKTQIQFCLCLAAACMPLSSHAAVELPYWLSPEWMATKIMGFHNRNTERLEQVQKQEKNKNSDNSTPTTANSAPVLPAPELAPRKPKLAPIEFATPKINEKYLSKDELHELRMQLKQKP